MRPVALWIAVVLGIALAASLVGCGESDNEGAPAPTSNGGGSINVTFTGAINGTSTKLVRTDCQIAARQHSGHLYGMSLWTVVSGKEYELALVINGWSGPVSLTLPQAPASGNQILFQVKQDSAKIFLSDTNTSGSIVQSSDLMSGTYDLHRLGTFGTDELLDVKATYKCT